MRLVARLLVLALLALVVGCVRDPAPQLIEATDVAPREIEAGDRIEVLGSSFPQGKQAKVTFRGRLFRPGEGPRDAEIAAQGDATSPTQIEIDFTRGLEELFCGVAEAAAHSTFEGNVEVAFPAVAAGAPPVSATIRNVTIDVRPPSPRRAILDKREAEGDAALAYYGIHASKNPPAAGGILIDWVAPGSRAEKAGIQGADVLTTFEHVRIDSLADVLPPPGRATVSVSLRRGSSSAEVTHELEVGGFKATPPADLYGAGLLLAIAAAVILLFVVPSAGTLAWIERKLAARWSARDPRRGERPLSPIERLFDPALVARAADRPLRRFAPYLVFVGVSAGFAVMPFGQYLIAADLDVGILYVVAVTSLVTVGLLTGGAAAEGRRGAVAGLRAAAQIVSYEVPAAIAVASVVVMTGSLRVQEIIHAQGGWPWEWLAFRSPVTIALALLFLTSAVATARRAPFDLSEADGDAPPGTTGPRAGRTTLFALVEHANVVLMSGIAAALFFGGWQVPGLDAGAQEAHVGLEVAGAATFLLKTWLVATLILGLRWALPRVADERRLVLCWKWLVPAGIASFALSAAWVAWGPSPAAQRWIAVAMFATTCLVVLRVAQRVAFHARSPGTDARLNPFL